jgi:hypothetical protein
MNMAAAVRGKTLSPRVRMVRWSRIKGMARKP